MRSRTARCLLAAFVSLLALGGATARASPTTCDFKLFTMFRTTQDPFSLGGGIVGVGTGELEFVNESACTLVATDFKTIAKASDGLDPSFDAGGVTWLPSAEHGITIGEESNVSGGYNGVLGSIEPGVEMILTGGTVSFGGNSVSFSFDVFDRDVHSGIFRFANGTLSDSYVLQGGDPTGKDTGLAFALSQADASVDYQVVIPGNSITTPEPAGVRLCCVGLLGIYALFRNELRKRA